MFYWKLTRMTIPKILSVSPLTNKEHPYKVKKKIVQGSFFIIFFYGSVSRKTNFSSLFPGPLIVHGLPVSCPFNIPNGNLKQQLSHIGVFICYQNIDAKK